MNKPNDTLNHLLPYEVTINLNVLSPLMKRGIRSNVDCNLIVTIEHVGINFDIKVLKQGYEPSHFTSEIAANDRFSTPVDDLAIVDYSFDFQEINESPRNM